MTYRDRRLRKSERLREWAAKRQQKSAAAFEGARRIADVIPMGQPILVGHHSEKRHRRDLDRIHTGMSQGIAHERTAAEMLSRADNIEAAADAAIYSDDPDAIEQLRARIATLEAERDRIKTVNALIRKVGLQTALPDLTDDEKRELLQLMRLCPYHHVETRGFPSYALQNLGGNITRQKARLAALSGCAGPDAPAQPVTDAATATARAGLTVHAGMTTPSRPGKQPRPVWTVRGNLAFWRPLLMRLGGSWYRGAFSFFDDPTEAIEHACAECEQDEAAKRTEVQ